MAEPSPKEAREPARKRIKLLAVIAAVICLFSGLLPPVQRGWEQLYALTGLKPAVSQKFSLTFLDVGSADAAILYSSECAILIDGGTYDCGPELYRRLLYMGIDHLDLVINTHPDKDHLGGFVQVFSHLSVGEYWEPELPAELIPETEEYRLVREALENTQTPIQTVSAGDGAVFGEVAIEVLSPAISADDTNNNSLVLKITYDGRSVLMMGDAEEKQEETLLSKELACDMLKVGHHGSNTSTGEGLLAQALPEYAVISAGKNRPPDERVLERLEKVGAKIFRTDTQGDITLIIENGEIWVSSENTE